VAQFFLTCCSRDSPIPEQPLGYNKRTTSGFISRNFSYAAFRLRDRSDPIATIARLYLWDPAKSRRARLWARFRDLSRATANHRRALSSFEFACWTAINLVESVRYKAIFATIMNNHSNVSSVLTKSRSISVAQWCQRSETSQIPQ